MFVVELGFESDPARLAARPAHRDRLQRLHAEGILVMAGPFADELGPLLTFDVPGLSDLALILDSDPYYRNPGVRVVREQRWLPLPK